VLGRLFGSQRPDLLTVLMTRRKDGLFEVQYIGDDAAPKEPRPAATIAELRTAVDSAIVAHYGSKLPTAGMSVGYAIYPWRETKVPKALAREIGGDHLVFDVEEANGRFQASHQTTGMAASADSLDALPSALSAVIAARWAALAPDVPGSLNWQRTLTEAGFVAYRR
jgi:hypothetical protein